MTPDRLQAPTRQVPQVVSTPEIVVSPRIRRGNGLKLIPVDDYFIKRNGITQYMPRINANKNMIIIPEKISCVDI